MSNTVTYINEKYQVLSLQVPIIILWSITKKWAKTQFVEYLVYNFCNKKVAYVILVYKGRQDLSLDMQIITLLSIN